MLVQRIVTAVVLLLFLLPALFYPSPFPFCALTVLFIGAAAWEWARLAGYRRVVCVVAGVGCALACVGAWSAGALAMSLRWLWIATAVVWMVGGAWLLHGGIPAWQRVPRTLRLAIGLLVLLVAWLAIAQARFVGVNFLLSVMVLVWVADIGAYFAGRNFGGRIVRRKLAPSISPGKTWEGALGGMVGVLVLALAWRWADTVVSPAVPSLYSRLLGPGTWFMLLAFAWLAGMSVVGDLAESLVKRAASVKDSSALLPGHGGVLDRIDALLPAVPLAMLLSSL